MNANQPDFIRLDCPRCGAPLKIGDTMLTCEYCGARLISKGAVLTRQAAPVRQPPQKVVRGVCLKPFAYYDPQSNLEAFSMLVPEGWQVNGGVTWMIQRPASPVQIGLQMASPNGPEAFEVFPNLYFTWTTNPLMFRPPGSLYFGYEVQQPVAARDAMPRFLLPRYRQVPDLAVAGAGPAQELVQAVPLERPDPSTGLQYSVDSVRVRLHYTLNGRPVGEEMSCVIEYFRSFTPGMFGGMETVHWIVSYITAFRAARENLDGCADLYRAIFTSFKLNPAWNALVKQVTQGLTSNQIRHMNQIGALSRQISQNADEMREMSMKGWQERGAAMDRVSEKFSQTIRGVDPYYDPNKGETVELPGGYTQAWSTPLGDYVLSDDPNFDPNVGSNQTFTPLAPPEEQ